MLKPEARRQGLKACPLLRERLSLRQGLEVLPELVAPRQAWCCSRQLPCPQGSCRQLLVALRGSTGRNSTSFSYLALRESTTSTTAALESNFSFRARANASAGPAGRKSRSSCARANASAGVGGGERCEEREVLLLLTVLEGAPSRSRDRAPLPPAS